MTIYVPKTNIAKNNGKHQDGTKNTRKNIMITLRSSMKGKNMAPSVPGLTIMYYHVSSKWSMMIKIIIMMMILMQKMM